MCESSLTALWLPGQQLSAAFLGGLVDHQQSPSTPHVTSNLFRRRHSHSAQDHLLHYKDRNSTNTTFNLNFIKQITQYGTSTLYPSQQCSVLFSLQSKFVREVPSNPDGIVFATASTAIMATKKWLGSHHRLLFSFTRTSASFIFFLTRPLSSPASA